MYRRFHILLIVATLGVTAACDGPGLALVGGYVNEVRIDGSRFRVYLQPGGNRVEAHRISPEPLPSLVVTFERAHRAIEQATGCTVAPESLRGDWAIVQAKVNCLLP